MTTTMLNNEFKHHDKLQAISLAERNSSNSNTRKSITVQHFNDAGQPDSPAEVVLCEQGHSPVAILSINGGHYVAFENDPQAAVTQQQGQWQDRQQYQNQNR